MTKPGAGSIYFDHLKYERSMTSASGVYSTLNLHKKVINNIEDLNTMIMSLKNRDLQFFLKEITNVLLIKYFAENNGL